MKTHFTYPPVKVLLIGLISTAAPVSVLALGIRLPDQDATATARGEAFVATADNPSAVYYNPAGITQLDGQHVSLGAYGIMMGSHYENALGVETDTKNKFQAVPQLFYTTKCPDYPLAFGLGVYSPYGLELEWQDTAPFTSVARQGEIQYITVDPVVAWQALPSLSLAMGPTLNWSQADLRNNPFGPQSNFRFRGRDTDVGYTAGILWKPLEKHAFGVSYRSSSDMNFTGHSDTHIPAFGVNFPGIPTSADFAFPQNVALGYSFRPTPKWNLEFDADWTDWDTLNTVSLPEIGQALPFNWQSSWFYEFGATRYLENGWSISGGYIFSENSVPDASFNPLVPDSDRHIFSLGIGKKYEKVSWNLAYQFAWGPDRTINNPGGPFNPINGTYEYLSQAIILNVGYSF